MKKIMIFGAGVYGTDALKELGAENVDYFIDNNVKRHGELFCGKPVIGLDEAVKKKDDYHIVVASKNYSVSMEKDLRNRGIEDYEVYRNRLRGYFETDELIVNWYEQSQAAKDENEWNSSLNQQYSRQAVYDEAERLYGQKLLFNHIEVETINRCNGSCAFCPVSRAVDPREKAVMSEELFYSIVDQLAEMDYSGRFTTFSNNEPLLDDRIIEFNRYARKRLPHARMHLYTNGTLLTINIFEALLEVLDELVIDNYHPQLKLIKPCQEIVAYCEQHPQAKKKATIVMRYPQEILTSRGGTAPNRKDIPDCSKERCVLPFKQLIVRPTGKVSLCCNDALGKYTLGDLTKESILDVWYGQRFQMVRECLYKGRENWGNCKNCDTFLLG